MDPNTYQQMQQQTSYSPSPDQSVLSQVPQNQPQVQPQDNENWFQKLLPTIGSIGLPLLGAALAPETGGLSLLASTALAGAGGALGKGAEDLTAGKDVNAGDLLTSGAEGAGGNILGAGIGKAIGGVGKVIGGVGERGLANETATNLATNAANDAQTTRNVFGGVKSSVLKANNLGDTQDLAKTVGVDANSPQAFVDTSNSANDIYNGVINNVLSKNGGVDTTGLNDIFKNAIGKNAGTLGGTDPVALAKGRIGASNTPGAKLYQQLQDLSAGISNRNEADPNEVRSMISKVGALAADAKPGVSAVTGAVDPTQKATYNTLNDIYGQLKNTLYNRPGVQSDIAALKGNIQPEDVGGNEQLASHINDAISGANSHQDILDELSKFTQMGNLGKSALLEAQNTASAASLNAAKQALPQAEGIGIPGTPVGDVASSLNHPIAKLTGAALNIGAKGGAGGKAAVNLGTTLSRIAPLTGNVAGETVSNAPNLTSNTAPGSFQTNIMQPNQQTPNQTALQLALNGSANPYEAGSYTPILNQLTQQAQQAHSGQAALQALEQAYQGAGGGQGIMGGLLAKLGGGLTGNNVAAYDAQRQQAMQILSKLGIPTSALPDVTNTNPAAMSQFQNIQGILNSIGQ